LIFFSLFPILIAGLSCLIKYLLLFQEALNRISDSAELNDNFLNKHVLNIVKSTLEEVKLPLSLLEELLELVSLGAYGEIDENVRIKLNKAYKMTTRLNRTVEGQLGNVYKSLNHFHITRKIPEWKKDIVNPVLGNIS